MNNQLTQYTKALTALTARRNKLQAEVDEINTLLNGTTNGHVRSESPRPRARAATNKLTLREAIAQAVKSRPLDKKQIVEAVERLGYRFTTNDPVSSISALVYSEAGKKAFRNEDGKFSVK